MTNDDEVAIGRLYLARPSHKQKGMTTNRSPHKMSLAKAWQWQALEKRNVEV
jgi:hypothetical protein